MDGRECHSLGRVSMLFRCVRIFLSPTLANDILIGSYEALWILLNVEFHFLEFNSATYYQTLLFSFYQNKKTNGQTAVTILQD